MRLWKTIKAAVPGPLIFLTSQWLRLFENTDLVYPPWAKQAQNTSLALGVVAIAIMSLVVSDWPKKWLKVGAAILLAAALAVVYYYLVIIGDQLGPASAPSELEVAALQRRWYLSFIGSMVLMMTAIGMAILSQPDPQPGWWHASAWWLKAIWILGGTILAFGLVLALHGVLFASR